MLLGSLMSACPPPPPPADVVLGDAVGDPVVSTASVRVGTGQSDYEDIPATDGRLELIYGAQGGYHVWGRARFLGLAPDVALSFTVTRLGDGQMLARYITSRRW